MGTFHSDKGELHGKTIAVWLNDGSVVVGRCDTRTQDAVYLNDADRTSDDIEAFLSKAKQFGHWPRETNVVLANDQVTDLKLLSEIS